MSRRAAALLDEDVTFDSDEIHTGHGDSRQISPPDVSAHCSSEQLAAAVWSAC